MITGRSVLSEGSAVGLPGNDATSVMLLVTEQSSHAGTEGGKKGKASELLQALSLLQSNMSPEDFAEYQILVAPKPKKRRKKQ